MMDSLMKESLRETLQELTALDGVAGFEQDVVRVGHHNGVEDMIRLGKDVEKQVLARGLRFHLEDRVLVHGNKTIVFG